MAACHGPSAPTRANPQGVFTHSDLPVEEARLVLPAGQVTAAKAGQIAAVGETRRTSKRIRKEIDEPGLRVSLAADVNAVVSTGTASSSATQHVRVRQGRSARSEPDTDQKEQS